MSLREVAGRQMMMAQMAMTTVQKTVLARSIANLVSGCGPVEEVLWERAVG
jgi:hypothetical protein